MKTETLLPQAIAYAAKAHEATCQRYDDAPYTLHLALVAHYAERYIQLIPSQDREKVLCAVWLHDTLEDCRLTYNDLKKVFGVEITEIVYAVTNLRGRTREDVQAKSTTSG